MKSTNKRRRASPFHPGRITISEILVKKKGLNSYENDHQELLDRHSRKRNKLRH